MPDTFNPQEWITTTEAAKLTGYTSAYFRQLVRREKLQGQKRGRDWFFQKSEVEAFAAKMKALGKDKHNPNRKKN